MRFGIFAGVAAFAASSLTVSAQPNDGERKQAREIYRTIVEMDTSLDGGRTPEMAKYLAERFRDGGFEAKDVHLIPVDKTAALVVRYRGDGSGGKIRRGIYHSVVARRRGSTEEGASRSRSNPAPAPRR